MSVDIDTYRVRIGLHYCRQIKAKGIKQLSVFELLIVLSLLLLKCGDVETNPGRNIDISLTFANSSSVTDPEKEIIKSKFSIIHYNVQSLVNKVELIEGELHDFDVICLTETWLDMRTLNDDLKLNGFRVPYRRDRLDDNHGGICVYVKESIFSQHRPEMEVNDVECL